MDEPRMSVRVAVWLRIGGGRIVRTMRVLMVLVVYVCMGVLQRLVDVEVLVRLREMQPHTDRHACCADHE